jgi:hypothetical protein
MMREEFLGKKLFNLIINIDLHTQNPKRINKKQLLNKDKDNNKKSRMSKPRKSKARLLSNTKQESEQ